MEETIKNTTRLLQQGTLTLDEANKILLGLFGVSRQSEQLKQKFTQCQNIIVLSGEKPLLTSIKFIEWDALNGDWKYYFDDEDGKQWFGYECEIEAR